MPVSIRCTKYNFVLASYTTFHSMGVNTEFSNCLRNEMKAQAMFHKEKKKDSVVTFMNMWYIHRFQPEIA